METKARCTQRRTEWSILSGNGNFFHGVRKSSCGGEREGELCNGLVRQNSIDLRLATLRKCKFLWCELIVKERTLGAEAGGTRSGVLPRV